MTSTSAGPSWASAWRQRGVELRRRARPACRSAPQMRGVLARSPGCAATVCHTSISAARCSLVILPSCAVVEQHVGDVHAVLHRGGELGEVLAEAAVAGDGDDRAVGRGRPRAHRRREPEADRAQVARHQHRLAGCTRSSGRTSRCCCRRRPRSPRRRARGRSARRTARPTRRRGRGRRPARRAFSARQIAQRSATSARWSTRSARRRSRVGAAAGAVTPTSPSTGTVTGWKRPSAIGSKSTWMIGLYDGDAGVVRERRAEHDQQVGLVHEPATPPACRCGRARRTERVVVGDHALGLERGEHRARRALGERARTSSMSKRAPWPTTITGRSAPGEQRQRPLDARPPAGRSRDRRPGRSGPTPARRRAGQHLHLVGQHEVGDLALDQRVLAARGVISSAWSESAQHGLRVAGDVGERAR